MNQDVLRAYVLHAMALSEAPEIFALEVLPTITGTFSRAAEAHQFVRRLLEKDNRVRPSLLETFLRNLADDMDMIPETRIAERAIEVAKEHYWTDAASYLTTGAF